MPEPSRWAVLIGIDHYSNSQPGLNLKRAVNDAILMYTFLRDSLKIPQSNFRLHLARHPGSIPAIFDSPTTSPTTIDVLKSIDYVIANAKPGDLVHIHFSGHGGREPTIHPDKKSQTGQDELLCFVDGDIDDIELGKKLDDMVSVPNSLVVSVSLDCCFSGGATRAPYSGIRCKPRDLSSTRASSTGAESENTSSISGARNASLQNGWLYRNRDYIVMAACQPFETARERSDAAGEVYGLFTSTLVSELGKLANQRCFMTYGEFHGLLDAVMKGRIKSEAIGAVNIQQPMLLGPRDRVLFSSDTLDVSRNLFNVTGVSLDAVVINRGHASGVRLSDIYRLKDQRKARSLLEEGDGVNVMVVAVRDYESDATFCEVAADATTAVVRSPVQIGWLAELIQRADVVQARVVDDSTDSSARILEEIRGTWESLVDPTMPIQLTFPESNKKPHAARFHVNIHPIIVEILNFNGKPFEHLPNISTESNDITKQLMHILGHLQSFLVVLEMRTPGKPQQESPYSASIVETSKPDNDEKVISSWLIDVQNHSCVVLFVAVFDLTPLHGIKQLIPNNVGIGHPVEPGHKLREIIDIEVPVMLAEHFQNSPSFQMKDVLKIFITTEPVDLRHLELEDLQIAQPSSRHGRMRCAATVSCPSWFVEEKEVITVSHKRKVTGGRS